MSAGLRLVAPLVLVAACSFEEPARPLKSTARVVHPVVTAQKSAGESCANEGVSVCRRGAHGETPVCLHYGPGLRADGTDENFVCSTTCTRTNDCALEFECVSLGGAGKRVCAPRAGFAPRVALARPTAPADPLPPRNFQSVDYLPFALLNDGGRP